jgi:hypothetical protein
MVVRGGRARIPDHFMPGTAVTIRTVAAGPIEA